MLFFNESVSESAKNIKHCNLNDVQTICVCCYTSNKHINVPNRYATKVFPEKVVLLKLLKL